MARILNKLKWICSHPEFKKEPIAMSLRILKWEIYCILKKDIDYNFDNGHKITLKPFEGASRLTYYFGVSEPDIFQFMECYLKPGMSMIDVGANIGLNAVFAARRVNPGGRVIAIEPVDSNYRRIIENSRGISSNILEVLCSACGSGESKDVVVHKNSKDSSRSFVEIREKASGQPASPIEASELAEIVSIDQIVQSRSIDRIDYLKIDVEGFESEVILGAFNTLSKKMAKVVQMEVDDTALRRNGSSAAELLSKMSRLGYVRCHWDSENSKFVVAEDSTVDFNSFFIESEFLKGSQAA